MILFAYAPGTDPEALLVLELIQSDEKLGWKYGFAPMNIDELKASRKNSEDWTIGERKVFNTYDTSFRVGPYRPQPGQEIPDSIGCWFQG